MDKSKKIWLSRLIGFSLAILILLGVGETIDTIIGFFWPDSQITLLKTLSGMGLVVSILVITSGLGKFFRTNPGDVSIGFTNIPNFMYDEDFAKEKNYIDKSLIKENKQLNKKIDNLEDMNIDLIDEVELKAADLDAVTYISDIFIRHHHNASRLVRSLIQLMDEGKPIWKYEFCNNVLDECVTILLEDRADKSSTIYFIENDELKMFAYNRIEFSSSRQRVFKKGEGFAGHIWDVNQTVLINDVQEENGLFQGEFAPKHEYGSILGVPIRVGKKVVGVLCIQSEKIEDFAEDDERTVVFYADMCGLAHFYDKILVNGKGC